MMITCTISWLLHHSLVAAPESATTALLSRVGRSRLTLMMVVGRANLCCKSIPLALGIEFRRVHRFQVQLQKNHCCRCICDLPGAGPGPTPLPKSKAKAKANRFKEPLWGWGGVGPAQQLQQARPKFTCCGGFFCTCTATAIVIIIRRYILAADQGSLQSVSSLDEGPE